MRILSRRGKDWHGAARESMPVRVDWRRRAAGRIDIQAVLSST